MTGKVGSLNTEMDEYFPSLTTDDSTLIFTRLINDNRALMGNLQEDIFISQKGLI